MQNSLNAIPAQRGRHLLVSFRRLSTSLDVISLFVLISQLDWLTYERTINVLVCVSMKSIHTFYFEISNNKTQHHGSIMHTRNEKKHTQNVLYNIKMKIFPVRPCTRARNISSFHTIDKWRVHGVLTICKIVLLFMTLRRMQRNVAVSARVIWIVHII